MIGEKIKKARTQNGLTQVQLSNLLHMDKSSIAKYETNAATPSADVLKAISELLHVNTNWLLFDGDSHDGAIAKLKKYFRFNKKEIQQLQSLLDENFFVVTYTNNIPILNAIEIRNRLCIWCEYCNAWHYHGDRDGHRVAHCFSPSPYEKTGYIVKKICQLEETSSPPSRSKNSIQIPVLGTIPAGIPLEAIEDIVDYEEIPASWAVQELEYFALKIKGDSMYPEYLEDDTVIFRKQSTCESGQDCAIYINDYESTFKRIFLAEDGSITVKPLNPNYPPRTFSPKEAEEFAITILGVAVELRRKRP